MQETAENSQCRKPVLQTVSKLEFSQVHYAADCLYFVFKNEDMQLNASVCALLRLSNKIMSQDTKMMVCLKMMKFCFFLRNTNGYLVAFRAFNVL